MSKLLKPVNDGAQVKSLTIKIPSALSERLAALSERAKCAGLTLDLDVQLSRALARLLKTAEAELAEADSKKCGGGDVV